MASTLVDDGIVLLDRRDGREPLLSDVVLNGADIAHHADVCRHHGSGLEKHKPYVKF